MIRASWTSLVTWTLFAHTPQCDAQTYPYTLTATVPAPYPATGNYLYDAEFTVYGNVKTIAGIVGNKPMFFQLIMLICNSIINSFFIMSCMKHFPQQLLHI